MAEIQEQDFTNVITDLQDANDKLTKEAHIQSDELQSIASFLASDANVQADQSRSLMKLWMSVSTGELGTGKYDEHQLQVLREMEEELINSPDNLDPDTHYDLLKRIQLALHGVDLTFKQKFDRFVANNISFLTSFSGIFQKITGQNIYERKQKEIEDKKRDRALLISEANYELNFLSHKFMITEMSNELRYQSDALRMMLARTPTLRQQEEDRMEARRRTSSFEVPGDYRTDMSKLAPEEQGKGFLSRIGEYLLGAVSAVGGGSLIAKMKGLKAKLVTNVKGAVTSFIAKVFGVGKFAKVAGPVGAILGLIETGKDVFDIANAVTSEDVRKKVAAKDIGGVVGSILGGAIGFAVGGPVGAAVGVSIGNSVGGYIGGLADKPEVTTAIDKMIEQLQTKLEGASETERAKIQLEIDNLQKLQEKEVKQLREKGTVLDQAYANRQEARLNLENALTTGDGSLIAKANLALKAAEGAVKDAEAEYMKYEKELEKKARDASVSLLKEMMSFTDRFANSKNAAVSFFGRIMGGTKSAQGALDVAKIAEADALAELKSIFKAQITAEERELRTQIKRQEDYLSRFGMMGDDGKVRFVGDADSAQGKRFAETQEEFAKNVSRYLEIAQGIEFDEGKVDASRRIRVDNLRKELAEARAEQVALKEAMEGKSASVSNVVTTSGDNINQMMNIIQNSIPGLSQEQVDLIRSLKNG